MACYLDPAVINIQSLSVSRTERAHCRDRVRMEPEHPGRDTMCQEEVMDPVSTHTHGHCLSQKT